MKVHKVGLCGLALLLTLLVLLPVVVIAQGDGYYTVSQGGTRVAIPPLEGPSSAVELYNLTDNQSDTGLEEANTAVFFLYRDTTTGEVSLFVLQGGSGGTAGSVTFTLSGVPAGADFLVQDDAADFRDIWELTAPTGSVTWTWDETKSDGMVLGPLGEGFELTVFPQFTTGITGVKLLYGSRAAPSTQTLNLVDPIILQGTLNQPPDVSFAVLPVDPRINQPVTFDASATSDPDGRVATYDWDFDGDGLFDLSSSDAVVTHAYATPGTKRVTVRVTDEEGASERLSQTIDVSEMAVLVTRTISTMSAIPGSTFKVVVRIEPEMDLAGAGLQEFVPVGWKVKPLESAGAAFKRAAVQWVFIDKIKAGSTKIISYEVTVPESNELIATTLPVCFSITGIFQAITPSFQLPVEGDSEIEITDALRIKTAIAHLIPRIGLDTDDRIDLRLSQVISPDQLRRAIEMWQNDESVPWTQGARIDLPMLKELSAYAYLCHPVDLPLPYAPTPNINAVRTIATPVPCRNVLLNYYGADGNPSGNTFTVKVEIWADQDLYGVGLDEDLPAGWRVTPIENGGFFYKPSQIQWIFPDKLPAGTCKIIIYQVEVPQSEDIETPSSDPCFVSSNDLFGVVDAALPCIEVPVTGDSAVDISDCLTVKVAISRWDVETDTIDITLSDKISFQQVQRAIAFWLEDEIVPRTCGGTVDYETLKEIVAYWLTNTNICDPLPGAVQEVCEPDADPCDPAIPPCSGG